MARRKIAADAPTDSTLHILAKISYQPSFICPYTRKSDACYACYQRPGQTKARLRDGVISSKPSPIGISDKGGRRSLARDGDAEPCCNVCLLWREAKLAQLLFAVLSRSSPVRLSKVHDRFFLA